ncbi:late embryogenesis abundant protein [Trifolium repens]|nr:late embryogenesis abundant protein [Trifolium repens]KAK2456473.1 late embryogenesis abundant protein [Trifolium repens]
MANRPKTNLASCVVATLFLIFFPIVILIVYTTVFKPKNSKITVNAVQLQSFSVINDTISLTLSQYDSVTNPNRAVFYHYNSSLQVLYSGNEVGFAFNLVGMIDAGRTNYIVTNFTESFPLSAMRNTSVMEIETELMMAGWIGVFHFFIHNVKVRTCCRVAITISNGTQHKCMLACMRFVLQILLLDHECQSHGQSCKIETPRLL